jgi:nucleoid DNA-binding protein
MTKQEMVHAIAAKTGVEQNAVKQIVQMTLDGIIDVIVAERRLELRDFGVFEVRMLKARKARNPRTGVEVFMHSRPKVCFKAGKIMNAKANGCALATNDGKNLPIIS